MKSGVRTAKRAVDVAEAAAVKKKATYTELVFEFIKREEVRGKHTPATKLVTQLPQRLQIAKTPTRSSTTVAIKATM